MAELREHGVLIEYDIRTDDYAIIPIRDGRPDWDASERLTRKQAHTLSGHDFSCVWVTVEAAGGFLPFPEDATT